MDKGMGTYILYEEKNIRSPPVVDRTTRDIRVVEVVTPYQPYVFIYSSTPLTPGLTLSWKLLSVLRLRFEDGESVRERRVDPMEESNGTFQKENPSLGTQENERRTERSRRERRIGTNQKKYVKVLVRGTISLLLTCQGPRDGKSTDNRSVPGGVRPRRKTSSEKRFISKVFQKTGRGVSCVVLFRVCLIFRFIFLCWFPLKFHSYLQFRDLPFLKVLCSRSSLV